MAIRKRKAIISGNRIRLIGAKIVDVDHDCDTVTCIFPRRKLRATPLVLQFKFSTTELQRSLFLRNVVEVWIPAAEFHRKNLGEYFTIRHVEKEAS